MISYKLHKAHNVRMTNGLPLASYILGKLNFIRCDIVLNMPFQRCYKVEERMCSHQIISFLYYKSNSHREPKKRFPGVKTLLSMHLDNGVLYLSK